MVSLPPGHWFNKHQDILITGTFGSGKTYLACALEPLKVAPRNDLMEIMDDRHGSSSTDMISQIPTDQWYQSIDDNTLDDAILDRLMHNAHRIKLIGIFI